MDYPTADLVRLVRAQAAEADPWQTAEAYLLSRACRDRLATLGVVPTADIGVALMAMATLLSEHAPEWGGDVRATLAEIARVGLELLEP